ncbi:MAG: hypothetical protein KZQ93_12615 [Candidatus Thiodiazotropha sp. (ex Monitilora ramsayi)]|nr:hypothetical protein [Candidatus Thiodiazotropha sp. (ex Monitilora ramsayi)]
MDESYINNLFGKLYKLGSKSVSFKEPYQLYMIGWGGCIFALLFSLIANIYPEKLYPVVLAIALISSLFILLGFVVDIFNVAQRLWSTIIGKSFLGLIATAVIQLSYLLSKHEVNNLTGLPAMYLVDSVSIFTVVLMPLVICAFFALFLVMYLIAYLPVFVSTSLFNRLFVENIISRLSDKTDDKQKKSHGFEAVMSGRFAGAYISLALIGISVVYYTQIFAGIHEYKKEAIAYVDYYQNSYCDNVGMGERYLPLKRDLISVARRSSDGWTFSIRKCSNLVD